MRNGPPDSPDKPILLKILRAIAHEQAALGSLAHAEVKKIQSAIRHLEQYGNQQLGFERYEFEKNFAAVLRAALNMYTVLQTKTQTIAEHLGIPYSPLLPLTPKGDYYLISCGQGMATGPHDEFWGGKAILQQINIHTREAAIAAGDINYSVCKGAVKQQLEALPGTLNIDWPGINSFVVNHPAKVMINGRATIKKRGPKKRWLSDAAAFSLTIWDYGYSTCTHKFRMVITADKLLSLNHDSGTVEFTGIVQRKVKDI